MISKNKLLSVILLTSALVSAESLNCKLTYYPSTFINTRSSAITYDAIAKYYERRNIGMDDFVLYAPHLSILENDNKLQASFLKEVSQFYTEKYRRMEEGKKHDKIGLAWQDSKFGIDDRYTREIYGLLSNSFGERAIYNANNLFQLEAIRLFTQHLAKIKTFSQDNSVDVTTFSLPYELILNISNKEQVARLQVALNKGLFDRSYLNDQSSIGIHFSLESILDGKESIAFARVKSDLAKRKRFIYNSLPPHNLSFNEFREAIFESIKDIKKFDEKFFMKSHNLNIMPERPKAELDLQLWQAYERLAKLITSLDENSKFNKERMSDLHKDIYKLFYGFWSSNSIYMRGNQEAILSAIELAIRTNPK